MNGGNLVLGRVASPVIVDSPNLINLTGNTIMNGGFQSISSSTSPILSQGTGKRIIYIFIKNKKKLIFLSTLR